MPASLSADHRTRKGVLPTPDALTLLLYFILVAVGILSVFSVEYQDADKSFFLMDRSHTKQLMWLGISLFAGLVILLTDSKFFSSFAFLGYLIGIGLLIITIFAGKDVKGSHSWLGVGSFAFQPGEVHKIFTALALAKFLSLPETNFKTLRDRLIAAGIAFLPMLIIIAQSETGLALVYLSFILAMYREGLPSSILIIGFSLIALTITTLLVERHLLLYILLGMAAVSIFIFSRALRRKALARFILIAALGISLLFSQFLVPFVFTHVLKNYQIERIYSMLGTDVPAEYYKVSPGEEIPVNKDTDYNVRQSKIAIGSGGLMGKGFLNGTSTRGSFVPEQNTDFIFCSVGEQFGFLGSTALIILYISLMLRILYLAERQRSVFSRVYGYCVASILFFHFAINISMTIGLAPVIGITLPFLSYGGSSLLSFSILIFILLRLDADRNVLIR